MDDFQYPPLDPNDVFIDNSQSTVDIEHTTIINKTAVPSADQSGSRATSAAGKTYTGKVNWGPSWAGKQKSFAVGSRYGEGQNGEGSASGNIDGVNDQQGFVASTGSKVTVSGGPHNESIEIVHASGAQVRIAPDGSISIVAGPSVGIASATGDTNVAGAGKVTVTGAEVFVESSGQLSLKSTSSSVHIEAKGDIILDAAGSMQLRADKRLVMTSGHDTSITAVDSFVVTTGNDASIQAAAKFNVDARASKIKTEKANELHAGESFVIKGKADSTISAKEKLTVVSGNDLKLDGKSTYVKSKDTTTLEGTNTTAIKSAIVNIQSKTGDINLDAVGTIQARSDTLNMFASSFGVTTGTTEMSATGTFKVDANGNMDLRGAPIDLNKSTPSAQPVPLPEATSAEAAGTPDDPDVAELPDPKAVAGAIQTSEVAAPGFADNAYRYNKGSIGVKKNDGAVDSEAEKIASETPAADSQEVNEPEQSGITYEGTPDPESIPAPLEFPNEEPLPVGDLGDPDYPGYNKIPSKGQYSFSQQEIQTNIQSFKKNVLQRIRKQFPDIGAYVSKGFEIKVPGVEPNGHHTGLGGDIMFGNKLDHMRIAEVANWMKNNLVFDLLKLERDGNKRMHIHIELPLPNQGAGPSKGKRTVQTCSDAEGKSCVNRIDVEFLYGSVPSTE